MSLREQLLDLGLELVSRMSSQERSVANARAATTALSRARVERNEVELFLEQRLCDAEAGQAAEQDAQRSHEASNRVSGG